MCRSGGRAFVPVILIFLHRRNMKLLFEIRVRSMTHFMNETPRTTPAMSLNEAHDRLTRVGAAFETKKIVVRGVAIDAWKYVPTTAWELFAKALAYADREFLVYGDERVTYDGFCRATLTIANLLSARGLKKGERVGLAMRNIPEWPAIFLGSLLAGAIIVPLNARWSQDELGYALGDCEPRFVFADGDRFGLIQDLGVPIEQLYVSRPSSALPLSLDAVLGPPKLWSTLSLREPPALALVPEDDATLFYTSGTSGAPKGALGTHRSLTTNVFAMPFSNARNSLRYPSEAGARPDLGPSQVEGQRTTLLAVPFFHVTGSLSILLPAMAAGGKLVLMHKFDPEIALRLIEEERVTITGGVPFIALSLLDQGRSRDVSSLELISYGGAPSPHNLAHRIHQELGAMPGHSWGMTETSATCTTHSGWDYLHRPASCGPALAVSRIKIMRDGRQVRDDSVGELWAFGPNVVKGYWNGAQATAEKFHDGWVKTGDLARIDAQGFLTIVDRMQDVLNRGGEKIYCTEVENILLKHPAVADAALIALPHALLGEVPAAVVQTRPGSKLSETALLQFAARHLASFKVPVQLRLRCHALPRNAGGKLIKKALRAEFGL